MANEELLNVDDLMIMEKVITLDFRIVCNNRNADKEAGNVDLTVKHIQFYTQLTVHSFVYISVRMFMLV